MKIDEISYHTFVKYFQNRFSSTEKKKISEVLAGDRFLSDAIEGFEAQPDSITDLNLLKNRFYFNKGIRNNFAGKYIFLYAVFTSIILCGLILFYKIKTPDVYKRNEDIVKNSLVKSKRNDLIIMENEISNALPLTTEKQITGKTVMINQPKTIVVVSETDLNILSQIPSRKIPDMSQKKSEPEIEKELDKKLITYSNSPIIYIIDLKTVDYSKIYKNRPVIPEVKGLESKFESIETKTVFTFENSTHYISYSVFLETALQKYTDADFKGAIRDFAIILKTFPADINAFFYGGLCMYNLQKSDKAIAFFNQVIESPVNSFYQEAKWYKTLSLIQKNDTDKAKQLLSEIIEESGFYAEKAKAVLKKLRL